MKTCFECGTSLPDDATICIKCGAPQTVSHPQTQDPVPPAAHYTPVQPSMKNIWESPVFAILSFVAAILILLAALVFLITTFIEEEFIFAGVLFFLAAILNIVGTLPGFISKISKK
jgi:uncharacterized membrane protein YvbJ